MQDASFTCLLYSCSDTSYVCQPVQYMVVPKQITLNGWSKITFAVMILHCSYNSGLIMNTTLKQVCTKHHTHKANYIKHQRVCEFVHQTRTSCFRLYLPQISGPSNTMSKPIMASCNQGWNNKKIQWHAKYFFHLKNASNLCQSYSKVVLIPQCKHHLTTHCTTTDWLTEWPNN